MAVVAASIVAAAEPSASLSMHNGTWLRMAYESPVGGYFWSVNDRGDAAGVSDAAGRALIHYMGGPTQVVHDNAWLNSTLFDINASGVASGYAILPDSSQIGFVYDHGVRRTVVSPGYALGIADDGTISGTDGSLHPLIVLPDSTIRYLALEGYVGGIAYDVSDGGWAAGVVTDGVTTLPAAWDPTGALVPLELPIDFVAGIAIRVNRSGEVVGGIYTTPAADVARPAVWRRGALTLLPTGSVPGGIAAGINDAGSIVGALQSASAQSFSVRGALWERDALVIVDDFTRPYSQAVYELLGISPNGTIAGHDIAQDRPVTYTRSQGLLVTARLPRILQPLPQASVHLNIPLLSAGLHLDLDAVP